MPTPPSSQPAPTPPENKALVPVPNPENDPLVLLRSLVPTEQSERRRVFAALLRSLTSSEAGRGSRGVR